MLAVVVVLVVAVSHAHIVVLLFDCTAECALMAAFAFERVLEFTLAFTASSEVEGVVRGALEVILVLVGAFVRPKKAHGVALVPTVSTPAVITPDDQVRRIVYNWLRAKVASTRKTYEHDLLPFVAFMNEADVPAAFAKLISIANTGGPVTAIGLCIAYHTSVLEQLRTDTVTTGLAPSTINRRLTALRSMISALRDAGLTTIAPPLKGVRSKGYRDTRGAGAVAIQRIVEHLEREAIGDNPRALRDLALLRLMFNRVLRRAEAITLDFGHVDLPGRRLFVLQKKHLEREWISIGQKELDAMRRWLSVRGDSPGPVFQSLHHGHTGARLDLGSVNRIMAERGKEAGIPNVRPHGLRHSGITEALERGHPLHKVKEFARHSKIDTTMIYDDNRGKDIIELDEEPEEKP